MIVMGTTILYYSYNLRTEINFAQKARINDECHLKLP